MCFGSVDRSSLFWLIYAVPHQTRRHSAAPGPEDQRVPDLITNLRRLLLCINTCREQAQPAGEHTHTHTDVHLPVAFHAVHVFYFFFSCTYRNVRSATERFGKHMCPFGTDSRDFIDINPRLLTAFMNWWFNEQTPDEPY